MFLRTPKNVNQTSIFFVLCLRKCCVCWQHGAASSAGGIITALWCLDTDKWMLCSFNRTVGTKSKETQLMRITFYLQNAFFPPEIHFSFVGPNPEWNWYLKGTHGWLTTLKEHSFKAKKSKTHLKLITLSELRNVQRGEKKISKNW